MFANLWQPWRALAWLIWGVNPVVTFVTVASVTMGLMSLIQLGWDGHVPTWAQQPKGYIIGDLLLALAAAIMQPLIATLNPAPYSGLYWQSWVMAGFFAGGAFIAGEFAQKKMHSVWEIVTPPLFCHHLILFGLLVPVLGGTFWIVLRAGGATYWPFWVVLALVGLYLFLNVWYDPIHRWEPFTSAPGSLGDRFERRFIKN